VATKQGSITKFTVWGRADWMTQIHTARKLLTTAPTPITRSTTPPASSGVGSRQVPAGTAVPGVSADAGQRRQAIAGQQTMIIECPQCHNQGTVDRSFAGQPVQCPQCGTSFTLTEVNPPAIPATAAVGQAAPPRAASVTSQPQATGGAPNPTGTIAVSCPQCQAAGNVAASFGGRSLKCPKCGATFVAGDEPLSFLPVDALQASSLQNQAVLAADSIHTSPSSSSPGVYHQADASPRQGNQFAINWAGWSLGGRITGIATGLAVLSMFFDWVSIGIASANGLSQGTFLLLGGFAYPCVALLQRRQIHLTWGLVSSIGATVTALVYIDSKNIEVFGESHNVAAGGAFLFLLCSIALIVGVVLYHKAWPAEQ